MGRERAAQRSSVGCTSFRLGLSIRPVPAVVLDSGGNKVLRLANAVRIGTLDANNRPTANGHAIHKPSLRIVVIHGIMLGRSVVPHGNGVRSPVKPELIFGNEDLVKQRIEQRPTFAFIHILDGDGELRIDEQYPATRDRMNAHHRVQLRWI